VPAGQSACGWTAAAGAELDALLAGADRVLAEGYPGNRPGRQPVHTVYVPADRFQPDLGAQWGRAALAMLDDCAPGPAEFGAAMDLPADLAAEVLLLVRAKLAAEPVEDLRLDFEDGYGERGDAAEDTDASAAADRLAAAIAVGVAPPFAGLRCKSLEPGTRRRAIATLEIFLGVLVGHRRLPDGFVITLPKVSSADQVRAMVLLCGRLEEAHGLAPGQLRFEVQVETPQLVLGADGAAEVARCVHAGGRRITGLHYGTYDYSAALGIAAAYHPGHLVSRYAATYAFFREDLPAASARLRSCFGPAPAQSRAEEPARVRALAGYLARGLDCGAVSAAELTRLTGLAPAGLRALCDRPDASGQRESGR
jgi:citrate lyase beta subunit